MTAKGSDQRRRFGVAGARRRLAGLVGTVLALVTVLVSAGAGPAAADTMPFFDDFIGAAQPGWTFRDGFAAEFPADTANHAATSVIDGHLSLSVPGGAEHNTWWLRQAEMLRPYLGSGVYEIKVDTSFTSFQQVGLSFESSPGSFMHFLLYGNGEVRAYAERFSLTGGTQWKRTVAGETTGRPIPATGPWYLRVTVADNAQPSQRTWKFQWSNDRQTWTTVADGVLEGMAAEDNAGAIQRVGVFVGNHPDTFPAFDARIDYFSASAAPIGDPLAPPSNLTASSGDRSVSLAWTPVGGANAYRVYRSVGTGAAVQVAEVGAASFADLGLTNGQAYGYSVSTVKAGVESARSGVVVATPVAAGVVPSAGLQMHLDASSLVGAVVDGAPVSSWSGVGVSASQAGSARPVFVAAGIGGKPSVRFDGVDDSLNLGSGFSDFTSGLSVFVVSRSSVLTSGYKMLLLGNGAGSANVSLGRNGTSAGFQYFTTSAGGSYGWFGTPSGVVVNAPQVVSVTQPGGAASSSVAATVSVNGSSVGSGSVFVPPVQSRGTNYLGRSYWGGDGWFTGDIAEVLVYNRTLSAAETATVTDYLNTKYGLGS